MALSCYALGLASYAALRLLAPAFYALGDARTPMLVSMASVLVNGTTAFLTVRWLGWGHAGLALSLSVVSIFNSLALLVLLRPRLGHLGGRRMVTSFAKTLAAAVPLGGVCLLIVGISHSRLFHVLVGIPLGAAVFYASASLLEIPELTEARDNLLRKLRRSR